ncbi:MAG: glycosyltransferase family 9 protein [Nitrospinae bacterium]|nr:glycosyltransferase family 9 protein [Nitrospinota bacterium]
MRLSTIRAVDFWVGVPLCLLLDFFALLLSPFLSKSRNIKNVLFLELSEAGSLVIGHSAISRLKASMPGSKLYFLIFERHASGLRLLDLIEEENIITIRDSSLGAFIWDVAGAVWKMREAGIDSVIDMELFSRASSVLSFLSFARNRVGFYAYTNEGLYRGLLIHNYKVAYNPYKHMALNFMALVETFLANEDDSPNLKRRLPETLVTPFKLPPSPERAENGMALIRGQYPDATNDHKIIIINPHAGELPIRAWGRAKFAETAKRILDGGSDRLVVIIGLPDAAKDGLFIEHHVDDPRCVNLVGQTKSLGDVVDLCFASKLLLTNDSGPAQYASVTTAKVVVLFGPETPSLYSPLGGGVHAVYSGLSCSPCVTAANHRNTVCRDNKCLQVITVDEVVGLCIRILNGKGVGARGRAS